MSIFTSNLRPFLLYSDAPPIVMFTQSHGDYSAQYLTHIYTITHYVFQNATLESI